MTDTKASDEANERLSKLLVQVLAATNDIDTLNAVAGLRRTLEGMGLHPTAMRIFQAGDASHAGHLYDMMIRAANRADQATMAADRYRARAAMLEAAFMEIKRVVWPLPAIDKADYRLKMEAEMARVPSAGYRFDPDLK